MLISKAIKSKSIKRMIDVWTVECSEDDTYDTLENGHL